MLFHVLLTFLPLSFAALLKNSSINANTNTNATGSTSVNNSSDAFGRTVTTVTIANSAGGTVVENKDLNTSSIIERLEDALYKGFDEVWPFIKQFPTVSDLRVQRSDLYQGIVNEGPWTEYSLRKIIEKVINGEKIHVLIVGESISAGANLGCRNNRRTYHYGMVMWWLKTITVATGSRLKRHQVAVGGVATNYFDRCWKEYLHQNETFDLLIWEFAFNDATAINQSKSIERFTISVANLQDIPGLLFVSFFRKNFFEHFASRKESNPCDIVMEEVNKRHEKHEVVIENIAKYYGVTLLDLERSTCMALQRNSSALGIQHMFNIDHPSYLAHAQMTFILIHYLRRNFANIVQKLKLEMNKELKNDMKKQAEKHKEKPSGFKRLIRMSIGSGEKKRNGAKLHLKPGKKIIPMALYLSNSEAQFNDEPICWTAILPNIHKKAKHDLFDLNTKYSKSFKKIVKMDWRDSDERRYDSTGGYYTSKMNQTIRLEFAVPSSKEQSTWRISVAIRNKYFGGDVEVSLQSFVNDGESGRRESVEVSKDIFDSSTKISSGVNVFDLSTKTAPGKKLLKIRTLTGGVYICAIIIS